MLNSQILSQARDLANDTDTSNPFHSDAKIYFFIDNWGIDIARYLKFPRKQQVISFAIGEGGSTGKNLDTDILTILSVTLETSAAVGLSRLRPITETELSARDPAWASYGNAQPTYYVLMDTVTVGTTNFPQKTISVDRKVDAARQIRIFGVQAPAALGSTGTNSPAYPPEFHETGAYFAAWKMLLPRDTQKAEYFRNLYLSERRRLRGQMQEHTDSSVATWDQVEVW